MMRLRRKLHGTTLASYAYAHRADGLKTGETDQTLNTGGTSTTTLPNTVYSYDAGGRLTSSFDSATGITTTYSYKPNTNYIQSVTSATSASSVVSSDSYTYRADGLKSSETDTTLISDGSTYDTRTLTWNYDALDRLTQEKSVDATNSALNYTDNYSYDLNSNRVSETEDQGNTGSTTDTVTSTYNADDELTQAVDANTGTTVYTYDNNGSQIETQHTPSGGTSPDMTTTNEYDLQGQMAGTQTTNSSGTTKATYEYDGAGNPDPSVSPAEIGTGLLEDTTVTGTNSPVTTYFLVDTQTATGCSQVIEQSAAPGTPTVTYVWGLNLISQNNTAGTPNAGTYYFVVDAHGSTVALLDASGNVVQTFHYDAFGNAIGFTPSSAITQYLYTQQYFDLASSTYYDWARNYNTTTGEFTQADYGNYGTITDPMSYLPYTFTGGDPINLSDLNGHDFTLAGTLTAISDLSLDIATQIQVYPEALVAATRLLAVVNLISFISDPQAYEQSFISTGGNPAEGFATLLDDMNSVGRDALVEWAQAEDVAQTNLALGGGLSAHELDGGHLIGRHVGKTLDELEQRLAGSPKLETVSSFPNRQAAESAVSEALNANQSAIQRWLANKPTKAYFFNYNAGRQVGYYLPRGGSTLMPATSLRVVLLPSDASTTGYYILTGYPIP